MNITQHLRNEVLKTESHVPLSGVTAYNLLAGGLSLSNSVVTAGMATTLYTGNGATQSVVTGVDMATQWGNSASETFGGMVWLKSRSLAQGNGLFDTIRGATYYIGSEVTSAQSAIAGTVTSYDTTGFTIGNNSGTNANLATYASWVFQTTHRISSTTNHGKAYTCHYNPFTGFTIIKYEGSGLAGHEIPHHLGRKLGFYTIKSLSTIQGWVAQYRDNNYLYLNTTAAEFSSPNVGLTTDTSITIQSADVAMNTATTQHIMYGWANSYFDESNTLIGNYEIGTYQGTGVAGNKVTTRGKPAWVMIKRLDSTSDWRMASNLQSSGSYLVANTSAAEVASFTWLTIPFNSDGFTLLKTTEAEGMNIAGGQYLYMVVYDNDSGSGKSKYNKATDTSAININATLPLAKGLDLSGSKVSVVAKNETITGVTLTQGDNYVYYYE